MDFTVIECTTSGLYTCGYGMQPAQASEWDRFWKSYSGGVWNAAADRNCNVLLYTVYGGGMIHPTGFQIGVMLPPARMRYMLSELDDALRELCRRASFRYELCYRSYSGPKPGRLTRYSTEKGRSRTPEPRGPAARPSRDGNETMTRRDV